MSNKLKSIILKSIYSVNKLVKDEDFQKRHTIDSKYFTRKRKLEIIVIIYIILLDVSRTTKTEIDDFYFNHVFKMTGIKRSKIIGKIPSKSAFCQARYKISEDAFEEIAKLVTKIVYNGIIKHDWQGYNLIAIDGSTSEMDNSDDLKDSFKTQGNQSSKVARGRISGCLDVVNNIFLDIILESYKMGEVKFVETHIDALDKLGLDPKKTIIIFDRGYPSEARIKMLEKRGYKYVFRCKEEFSKLFDAATQPDQIVTYSDNKTHVRVLNITLDNGENERLLTNLFDIDYDEFKDLYFKRWRIEEAYDTLKNIVNFENYSSRKKQGVKQDFYSAVFRYNLLSAVRHYGNLIINRRNMFKDLKYEYITNFNVLYSTFAERIISLLWEKRAHRKLILDFAIHKLENDPEYSQARRPGRTAPRKKQSNRRKQGPKSAMNKR